MKSKKRPATAMADGFTDNRSKGPLMAETGTTGGHSYRVYIPSTPKWKIDAIARFVMVSSPILFIRLI